ncbi:hydroxyneurosporene-O-methyltransferase [Actinoplanes regularis]|uniref:Hydroxyneurosporene-O-methyltransferase n=2 Tax=Actinoplanes regularis TaxID=52697 RepID=A0A239DWQ3_9ACTN|nr:hydroxyneurosporene-O-methyltransferase [Actinoplanes regularis]SNS36777.1 hydroxyneurosporene-O-methyltransferase [Actinoplanes regularis]
MMTERRTTPDHEEALRLLRMAEGLGAARLLQLAVEFSVADLLAEGPRGADDLAETIGAHPQALYRLLRALAGIGVCTEVTPGRFALTEMGKRLDADHPQSLYWWVRFQTMLNPVYDASGQCVRDQKPVFSAVYGEPIFEHLASNAEHGEIFNAAMAEHSRVMGTVLATGYDFSGVRRIVDVGGGDGTLLTVLLERYPEAEGVVFDLPEVVEVARKRIGAAGLSERCDVVGGDFLREVPAGADLYVLKGVLHNWSDADAAVLLRNCRAAMGPGSRLLLIEAVVPPGDEFHPSKVLDVAMMIVYGGRERTLTEHTELLVEAGLRFDRMVDAAAPLSVIEAYPA